MKKRRGRRLTTMIIDLVCIMLSTEVLERIDWLLDVGKFAQNNKAMKYGIKRGDLVNGFSQAVDTCMGSGKRTNIKASVAYRASR